MPEGLGFIRVNEARSPAAIVRVNDPRSLEGWGGINGTRSLGWGACGVAREGLVRGVRWGEGGKLTLVNKFPSQLLP